MGKKTNKKTPLCTKWCPFFLHVDISVTKLFPLQDHVPRCSYIMAFTEFLFFFIFFLQSEFKN